MDRPTVSTVAEMFLKEDAPPKRAPLRSVAKPVKERKLEQNSDASSELADRFGHDTRLWKIIAGVAAVFALLMAGLYRYAPAYYYEIGRKIPFLVSSSRPEYESAWASGEVSKMVPIARAAIDLHDPAAENAIIESSLTPGSVSSHYLPGLLRVVYNPLWSSDLSRSDIRNALTLALVPLIPDISSTLPPLASLSTVVKLALASQIDPKHPGKELQGIGIGEFARLPGPYGEAFTQVEKLGAKTLGDPIAVSLAALTTDTVVPAAVEVFFASSEQIPVVFAKLGAILPFLEENTALGDAVFSALRDKEGPLGQALSWFNIEELAGWSRMSGTAKLKIMMGRFPGTGLAREQYADLLLFPLPSIRGDAAKILSDRFLTDRARGVLAFLSSEQCRFTREQVISLIAALNDNTDAGASFITLWFKRKPDPDSVAILLAARANYDPQDRFNLEFARYLRQNEWKAPLPILEVLAAHPEPLARSLAYAKLDATDPVQAKILQSRLAKEDDAPLKEMLATRLKGPTAN